MHLPVAVPDGGGIGEAVESGVNGFIYPALDHQALAQIMIRFHLNPEKRREMGRQARRIVEERFSVGTYVRRLYEMYGCAA